MCVAAASNKRQLIDGIFQFCLGSGVPHLCKRKEKDAIVHLCDPDTIVIKVVNGVICYKAPRRRDEVISNDGWAPVDVEWLIERYDQPRLLALAEAES